MWFLFCMGSGGLAGGVVGCVREGYGVVTGGVVGCVREGYVYVPVLCEYVRAGGGVRGR